jgi:hypothetical protein
MQLTRRPRIFLKCPKKKGAYCPVTEFTTRSKLSRETWHICHWYEIRILITPPLNTSPDTTWFIDFCKHLFAQKDAFHPGYDDRKRQALNTWHIWIFRVNTKVHRGGPGSSPGHVMWDLWRTKWHWCRFYPSTSVSPASFHSTNCSTLTIIYHLGLVE